jgi:hypothetical protein
MLMIKIQTPRRNLTVQFLCHAIDVDAGSGHMPVAERLLRFAQRHCSLNHHSRECVACPVQVELSDPGLCGEELQVLYK